MSSYNKAKLEKGQVMEGLNFQEDQVTDMSSYKKAKLW